MVSPQYLRNASEAAVGRSLGSVKGGVQTLWRGAMAVAGMRGMCDAVRGGHGQSRCVSNRAGRLGGGVAAKTAQAVAVKAPSAVHPAVPGQCGALGDATRLERASANPGLEQRPRALTRPG